MSHVEGAVSIGLRVRQGADGDEGIHHRLSGGRGAHHSSQGTGSPDHAGPRIARSGRDGRIRVQSLKHLPVADLHMLSDEVRCDLTPHAGTGDDGRRADFAPEQAPHCRMLVHPAAVDAMWKRTAPPTAQNSAPRLGAAAREETGPSPKSESGHTPP